MRAAMGASRLRIARQRLIKSILLTRAGGGLAVGIAYWAAHALFGIFATTVAEVFVPFAQATAPLVLLDSWRVCRTV